MKKWFIKVYIITIAAPMFLGSSVSFAKETISKVENKPSGSIAPKEIKRVDPNLLRLITTNIDVPKMTGTGLRFNSVPVSVNTMKGKGLRFDKVTIETDKIIGIGLRFDTVHVDVDKMNGTGNRQSEIKHNPNKPEAKNLEKGREIDNRPSTLKKINKILKKN